MKKKRAVKTTIVGGQPPGNERSLQSIPVGIEEIIAMAAVDREFAHSLYEDRSAAVTASGVRLTPTEKVIFESIDNKALTQMVASIDDRIPETDRRAFLRKSAAALLALVGGGIITTASLAERAEGGDGGVRVSKPKGIRPDRPGARKIPKWTRLDISISDSEKVEEKAGVFENFPGVKDNKDKSPFMVYFYIPGSNAKDYSVRKCIRFEKALASSAEFIKAAVGFGKYICDATGFEKMHVARYKIKVPCIVFFDGKGNRVHRITHFPRKAKDLARKLGKILKDSDKACGIEPGKRDIPRPEPGAKGGVRADRPKPANRDKSTSPARGGVRADRPKGK